MMKHLWSFAFVAVILGCTEIVPGTCYRNPTGGAGGAGDMPIGAGVGATTSGDFADPPRQPQDSTDPPEGCIEPAGPCEGKCLTDYETAAAECGKIQDDSQRRTCQDDAHAKYQSCRGKCAKAPIPPRENCREHVVRCSLTKIAKNCEPCLRYCEGQGRWEDWAGGGTIDCRWWLYE